MLMSLIQRVLFLKCVSCSATYLNDPSGFDPVGVEIIDVDEVDEDEEAQLTPTAMSVLSVQNPVRVLTLKQNSKVVVIMSSSWGPKTAMDRMSSQ